MDKNEILEKSRTENQPEDERDRQISQRACEFGYRAVIGVNCCLVLLLFLQNQLTGKAFVTWWPFALSVFVCQSVHDLTLYRFRRKPYDLIMGLIGAIAVVIAVVVIIWKGFF